MVEFVNEHLVPKLTAKDGHEWRLAHETRNMALIAEMRLRASLFRTESRGTHLREDFPKRMDPEWLAWVKIAQESGRHEAQQGAGAGEMVAGPLEAGGGELPTAPGHGRRFLCHSSSGKED